MQIDEYIEKFIRANGGGKAIQKYTRGQCLVFAKMLSKQYPGEIIFLPEYYHFVFLHKGKLYDATGNTTKRYKCTKKTTLGDLPPKILSSYVGA